MTPVAQWGNFNYFMLWDYLVTGGRYFESTLVGQWNSTFTRQTIKANDGIKYTIKKERIFTIGCVAKINDDVIAYDVNYNRGWAMLGK